VGDRFCAVIDRQALMIRVIATHDACLGLEDEFVNESINMLVNVVKTRCRDAVIIAARCSTERARVADSTAGTPI